MGDGSIEGRQVKPDDIPEGMKYCPRCEQVHPLRGFAKSAANKDGKQGWCSDCIKDHPGHKAAQYKRIQRSYANGYVPPWAKT